MLKPGLMYKLKVIRKYEVPVIFGYIWKGNITATCEDFKYANENGLFLVRKCPEYQVIGDRVCMDTREIAMVTEIQYNHACGTIIFKVWGQEDFAFFEFSTQFYRLEKVTEFVDGLRPVKF